jgi:uncharacterized protein YjbI with pentapeptide repeats
LAAPLGGPRISLREFGVDLTQLRMPNCRFERVDFSEIPFSEGTVFTACTFVDCSFAGVSAGFSVFSETNLDHVDFTGADLNYADFSRSTFVAPRFEMTSLEHVQFSSVILDQAEFIGPGDDSVSMRQVQFINARATQLVCSRLDMREALFSTTRFVSERGSPSPPRFERCDLRDAHFIGTNLSNANFRGSDLGRTEFARSPLDGADFGTVRLADTDLSESLRQQLDRLKTPPSVLADQATSGQNPTVIQLRRDA